MIESNYIPRKATNVLAETELDGEVVLMNIDTGSFHALKGTGLAIWQMIDGSRDLTTIKAEMRKRFDVDDATCSAEVDAFVQSVAKVGFVESA